MGESVRDLLVEIVQLRRGQYDRAVAAGESAETQDSCRLRYLEARLELARHETDHEESQ